MITLKHFANGVSPALAKKMSQLADLIKDDFISAQLDSYIMARIDEISGVGYSGFIPHQDGGFTVSERYPCGVSSGCFFTQSERKFCERMQQDAENEWLRENELDAVPEGRKEECYEYQDEWMRDQDTILSVELWTGHNQDDNLDDVTIRLSLNYKDAPYYRSKYAEDIIELKYTAAEFIALDPAACVAALQTALDTAS